MGKGKPKPKVENAATPGAGGQEKPTPQGRDVGASSVGDVQIRYQKRPTRAPEGKRIHARRPLPLVREARLSNGDDPDDAGKTSGTGNSHT